MSMTTPPGAPDLAALTELLSSGDVKRCCAAVYAHPGVRWLLGDELHPGGQATTKRALELTGVGPGSQLLDIASGAGDSSLLAARELGCIVTGIDYGEAAVNAAAQAAVTAGVGDRVAFRVGDAEALPFANGSFDAALCECSLCTFPDKPRALAEVHRVLRPGGRVVIADVVADHDRLPPALRAPLATVACIGAALSREHLLQLLASSGFSVVATEYCTQDAAEMAERVYDRLRGARILGADRITGSALAIEEAIGMAAAARTAIAQGALDYAIFAAARLMHATGRRPAAVAT
jgi:ubiquinone/menaquinone biosynthesis C-methylase UbiE